MTSIEEIYNHEMDFWLEALPEYQNKIIKQLYEQENSYEKVANLWLQAAPAHTVTFGTEKEHNIFWDKFLDELELFVRGDDKYKTQNEALLKQSSCIQTFVVSGISGALALKLGVAASFITPVVVLMLGIIGKMGVNAWLKKREEERNSQNNHMA